MRDVLWIYVAAALLMLGLAVPVSAQETGPSAAFVQRAEELVGIVNGEGDAEGFFAPSFLAQVPAAQMAALSAQMVAQQGAAQSVSSYVMTSPYQGRFDLKFEKAIGEIGMTVSPDAPHQVVGLLVTGFRTENDSIDAVRAAFEALSGRSGFMVARLTDQGPETIAEHNSAELLATGSSFKLYILAELANQVAAGERDWSDVVTLDAKSLPSGVMQDWPQESPVTLATLATLMISISDNSAAYMLLKTLGRERVEARLAKIGHSDPAAILPFLSTVEAFALKMDGNADLRTTFLNADEAAQRNLLEQRADELGLSSIDVVQLTGGPRHVDSIEWLAAPRDMVALLDHLRKTEATLAREIMAISPGPGANGGDWDYLGFKGGSEPGVIHLAWLACSAESDCYAIVGGWTDTQAAVDNDRFTTLMTRLLALTRQSAQ